MRALSFKVEQISATPSHDAAYLNEDDDLATELARAVMDNLSTSIMVTIGDTTMHLAAWQDPEHWEADWAQELGVDFDDAPEAVQAILEGAVEVRP